MSLTEGWKRYREWLFDDEALGFRLDVSRTGLDASVVASLAAPLARAFEEMHRNVQTGIPIVQVASEMPASVKSLIP